MKVNWAVLCASSAIDKDSNNMSLFNIMEEVRVPASPPPSTVYPSDGPLEGLLAPGLFQLVILFARSDEEIPEHKETRVRVIAPDGDEMTVGSDYDVNLRQFLRLRARINFPGLPLKAPKPTPGTYEIIIQNKNDDGGWSELYRVPLRVVVES